MYQIPILRGGQPYWSKEQLTLVDYASGDAVAKVSMANSGLVSRDLNRDDWSDLQLLTLNELLERMAEAADHFMQADLPVGDGLQSPQEFVRCQSATTGLPHALCELNMTKIEAALRNMRAILDGLTGGLDLRVLDDGYGQRDGHMVSFAPKARRFGAVLPANSPGVHALWPPAIALKMPVALKPGQREPWTPLRILESMRRAGIPDSGFGLYPCGHDGAGVILRKCGASMLFGSGTTVDPWRGDPRVEIHGPGDSKILLGPDVADSWHEYMGLIAASVAANGGRSCINASAVRTVSQARPLADALAQELLTITPRERDDPQATLAAFADPRIAHAINDAIDRELSKGGAIDVSAELRGSSRLVEFAGGTYLLPTVIYCEDLDHPLANCEYLFPFVSVTETTDADLLGRLGPSLVVTALTDEKELKRELMARGDIGRLNLGPIPTTVLQWDQPHEGNLFEHLYQQRAFQQEPLAATTA
jgi:hypothetical protein